MIQIPCLTRLNKSESLLLLLIMKMNRHLLHGAWTSQNKISNINNAHSLVLITHNNLQAKTSNHIEKGNKLGRKKIEHVTPKLMEHIHSQVVFLFVCFKSLTHCPLSEGFLSPHKCCLDCITQSSQSCCLFPWQHSDCWQDHHNESNNI